jgi:hypothetical protein
MIYEPRTPDLSVVYAPELNIPPINTAHLDELVQWSLTGLPHRVETFPTGDAVIHLSSGRAVRITTAVLEDDDLAHLEVTVHEIEESDIPEMVAIHATLMQTIALAATVMWSRQQAGA